MKTYLGIDLHKRSSTWILIYENKKVETKLAYAIGKADPVMAVAVIDGVETEITGYDLSPKGIRTLLALDEVKYKDTCTWGHFGRGFSWR